MAERVVPVLGASVAVFRDGRVLLGRRAGATMRGLWSLPGGRVEGGETLAAAALRELFEETRLRAELVGIADMVEVISDTSEEVRVHFVVVAFAGRWLSGEAEAGAELDAVRWVDPVTLDGLTVTDGLADVVTKAAERLRQR